MNRIRLPGVCAAIGLLALLVGPSLAFGRDGDTTPPSLLSLSIDPTAVDVTAAPGTVHVQIGASDDLSGVPTYFYVYLFSPSGGQQLGGGLSLVSGTAMNGAWGGDVAVPLYSEPGDWELRFTLADVLGNAHYYQGSELAALGFPSLVHVTSTPDLAPPTLLSLSLSPATVDVSAQPDTVHVQVGASDGLSGLQGYFYVYLYSPSGNQQLAGLLGLVSGNVTNGSWGGDVVVPPFSEPGDWELRFTLADVVGNAHYYQAAELVALGFPSHVGVTSTPDAAPPTLLALSMSPDTIEVTARSDTVHVEIGASDDLSGLQGYFYVYLYSPSGSQQVGGLLSLVSGTVANGTWAGDLVVPPFSEPGDWELRFTLADVVGNAHYYQAAELAALGFPATVRAITYGISAVSDVGNDQGRRVRVSWGRHPQDAAGAGTPVTSYSVWRRIGPYLKDSAEPDLPPPVAPAAYPPGDWDYVRSVPAHGEWSYNTVCETLADSTIARGLVWSVFFVRAETASPLTYFDAAPDSGYSVDNLPPAPPAGLAGFYAAGTTHLTWNVSAEADLWYYRLYRGASAGFVPGPANLIAACGAAAWVDAAGPGFYKLSAVDVNGNESPFTALNLPSITAAPGVTAAFRLLPCRPNPFNPRTLIRFELPVAGTARLAVFDVGGRCVRVLVEGSLTAGMHEAAWDGRDAAGREAGSGTYLARLEAGGDVAVVRLMLVR